MTQLPIHTKETVQAFAPHYLRQLARREAGAQRHVIGKVLASHPLGCSYFIARCQIKELKQYVTIAHGARGKRGRICGQTYARTTRLEYRIARIDWQTHSVEELSTHQDRPSADKALIAAHQSPRD